MACGLEPGTFLLNMLSAHFGSLGFFLDSGTPVGKSQPPPSFDRFRIQLDGATELCSRGQVLAAGQIFLAQEVVGLLIKLVDTKPLDELLSTIRLG